MYNILYTSSPSHSKIFVWWCKTMLFPALNKNGTGFAKLPGKELQWQFRKRGEAGGRMGLYIPSHNTKGYGKSSCFIGKSSINGSCSSIFHSYVSLLEGNYVMSHLWLSWSTTRWISWCMDVYGRYIYSECVFQTTKIIGGDHLVIHVMQQT